MIVCSIKHTPEAKHTTRRPRMVLLPSAACSSRQAAMSPLSAVASKSWRRWVAARSRRARVPHLRNRTPRVRAIGRRSARRAAQPVSATRQASAAAGAHVRGNASNSTVAPGGSACSCVSTTSTSPTRGYEGHTDPRLSFQSICVSSGSRASRKASNEKLMISPDPGPPRKTPGKSATATETPA